MLLDALARGIEHHVAGPRVGRKHLDQGSFEDGQMRMGGGKSGLAHGVPSIQPAKALGKATAVVTVPGCVMAGRGLRRAPGRSDPRGSRTIRVLP